MPAAEEAVKDGRLDDALADLQQQVRDDPAAAKHRIFLFQLLAVQGQWDRALNQLDVAAGLDASALAMAQTYRVALDSEALRAEIFAGRRSPVIFGEPPEWMGRLVEALRLTAEGRHDASGALRAEAFEAAPGTAGEIDGQRFDWIADADPRLGPVIEAIVNGRYYWVPFSRVAEIRVEAPEDLRDLVWAPAHFRWSNGGEAVGLIPARYPGTESSDDEQLRLGRRTEWVSCPGEMYMGLGQRMLATDIGEFPLLQVRRIAIRADGSGAEAGPEEGRSPWPSS